MKNVSAKCIAKLSEEQKSDLRWRRYWIAGREYYRVNDPGKMQGYDEIANKSYPEYTFDDGNGVLNKYLLVLGDAMAQWLPGWDDTSCSFDQKYFACFAWTLAKSSKEKRDAVLKDMKAGKDPGDFDCEGEVVTKDPIYSTAFPGNKPAPSSTSMWPWIIGLATVGVVGSAIFFDRKQHAHAGSPSHAHANPAKMTGYKKLGPAIKHAYRLAVVEDRDHYVYARSDGFHIDTAEPSHDIDEEYIRVTPGGDSERWVRGRVGWGMLGRSRVR